MRRGDKEIGGGVYTGERRGDRTEKKVTMKRSDKEFREEEIERGWK
jgi:hypothetical protein